MVGVVAHDEQPMGLECAADARASAAPHREAGEGAGDRSRVGVALGGQAPHEVIGDWLLHALSVERGAPPVTGRLTPGGV